MVPVLLTTALLFLATPVQASFGMFVGPHPDFGVDNDADNRFEFLQLDVTVDVSVGGDFEVRGRLFDITGATFITNNSTLLSGGVGAHMVPLLFEGMPIFESEIDGPYSVTLELWNDTFTLVDGDVEITEPYSYVAFGPIFAFVPPHTDVGLDTDGNGLFNFIQVNVSANTSLPGFYLVFGFIASTGIMDMKIRVLNLTAGDHIIPLNFSGVGAFISGDPGPYTVFLQASGFGCGSDPGLQDLDVNVTAPYFFTEFENGIQRTLTGTVTNATTGLPAANETVWLTNESHRWLTAFETNATGDFSFVTFEGEFVLLAGAGGLQDRAIPLTVAGDTNVNVNLTTEVVDTNRIALTLGDWGNLSFNSLSRGFADNQSLRFLVDQFVGNGDLTVDPSESRAWMDLFRTCFSPFPDTTGQFEVDAIPFQLVNGTFVIDGDVTGDITSTAPARMTQTGNYTAQSPIPASATHQVLLSVSYDERETEVYRLTFPSAWVLASFSAPANVSVGPLDGNSITVDPLGRPLGDPPSVIVLLNASLDATPPQVTNASASPNPQEVFAPVDITAMVTDNSGVASVTVNVTDPAGGTVCNCTMTRTGLAAYVHAAPYGTLGPYNFTVWARDDAGLFASAAGTFTIQDTTPPTVEVPTATPDPQEAGASVSFAVAVTDNFQVDTVTLVIVDPDAIVLGNFTMTKVGGVYTHLQAFTKLGLYDTTAWAADTSGNLASRSGQFTIADTTAPLVQNVSATPNPQEVFGGVTIYANASDNSGIASVRVQITDPGGAVMGNFTMTPLAGGPYVYAAAYGALGTYPFTVWVEDTGGLFGSGTGSFVVRDTTPPALGTPSANPTPQEAGLPVDFAATASDNFQLAAGTIAIRDPANVLLGNFTMTFVGGSYTYSSAFSATGTHTYTIWASDTSGNLASGGGQFTVQDTTPPQVTAAFASPDPQEVFQNVTLTANVTENGTVATVNVRIEDPSGGLVSNITMTAVDADTYAHTLVPDQLGVYRFTVWVADEAGLIGMRSGNFTIADTTAPTLAPVVVDPDPQELGLDVGFSVQASDNDQLATVTLAVQDPNATPLGNFTMTLANGTHAHTAAFPEPGIYTYTVWAIDASGNGARRTGSFTIRDSELPVAAASGPATVGVGASFTLDASGSSDNHRIVNYTWDFGDGTFGYGATATHAYEGAGEYTVRLTVRDASGNEDVHAFTVTAVGGGGSGQADTILYGLLAALAAAGVTAGVLFWYRRGRAAEPKQPTEPPEGGGRVEEAGAEEAEPPEPDKDELDEEIERLLKT